MSYLQLFLLLFLALVAVLLWRFPLKTVRLQHALGVRTLAGRFTELIPEGAELPFVFSDLFHNALDFQDDIHIELTQKREGALHRVAMVTLDGFPLKPMGMNDVEIRLVVGRNKKMRMIVHSKEARILKSFGPFELDV
jgi:molecular chaperone DnaK (HSP70)